ncbi:MAG: proline dehydrogenase family protein [Bacteroidota bacterium]
MSLSFDNTQIAFESKTNKDLNRSYWLFKMVGNPSLVIVGEKLTHFALATHLPINGMIKATIFKQFCGGENISECETAINQLAKYKIGTILDYSVEGKESETDFDATMNETIATVLKAKGNKAIPFSVFKVTGLARFALLEKVNAKQTLTDAEQQEFTRIKNRVEKICRTAFENDVRIFIDAEESWIQDAIDDLANDMMRLFNKNKAIVYNTYQLYRHDRLAYLKHSVENAIANNFYLGAKLVRGAYMEKERARAVEKNYPSPIQSDKQATDRDYDLACEYCIENNTRVAFCAGTHNELSSKKLADLMLQKNVSKDNENVFFSQLLGMSDHISYNLSKAGYNVAKYVPYGPVKEVLPYLIRRAKENTSVKGQTGRELGLIMKEKARREAEK